jgi:hypothetical protein
MGRHVSTTLNLAEAANETSSGPKSDAACSKSDDKPLLLQCRNDPLDCRTRQMHPLCDLPERHSARIIPQNPQDCRRTPYDLNTTSCLALIRKFNLGHGTLIPAASSTILLNSTAHPHRPLCDTDKPHRKKNASIRRGPRHCMDVQSEASFEAAAIDDAGWVSEALNSELQQALHVPVRADLDARCRCPPILKGENVLCSEYLVVSKRPTKRLDLQAFPTEHTVEPPPYRWSKPNDYVGSLNTALWSVSTATTRLNGFICITTILSSLDPFGRGPRKRRPMRCGLSFQARSTVIRMRNSSLDTLARRSLACCGGWTAGAIGGVKRTACVRSRPAGSGPGA